MLTEAAVAGKVDYLRGLKEKYEQHHGVRIADSALVAAATLSNRYITDRFLPDKAIDVLDEAAAGKSMQHMGQAPEIKKLEEKEKKIDEARKKKDAQFAIGMEAKADYEAKQETLPPGDPALEAAKTKFYAEKEKFLKIASDFLDLVNS